MSALVGPYVAFTLFTSAIYDTTCLRRESRKLQAGSFISAAPPRPPPAARCRGGAAVDVEHGVEVGTNSSGNAVDVVGHVVEVGLTSGCSWGC